LLSWFNEVHRGTFHGGRGCRWINSWSGGGGGGGGGDGGGGGGGGGEFENVACFIFISMMNC